MKKVSDDHLSAGSDGLSRTKTKTLENRGNRMEGSQLEKGTGFI